MTFEEIKNKLVNAFGESIILSEQKDQTQPSLTLDTSALIKVAAFLRDNEELYFDYLNCLSGVDYGIDKNELSIVYHLSSIPYKHSIVLKINIPFDRTSKELPHAPSVSKIWRSADWHEREVFDLYGVIFDGHTDMRRILCPDDWEGHPLRKDYVAAEYYHDLKITFDRNTNNDKL